MWFGYSPFECDFLPNNSVRVVECSALRVLANIPKPPSYQHNAEDRAVYDMVVKILAKKLEDRMFTKDIIILVTTQLNKDDHHGGSNYVDNIV
jgi:hypothetical protein